MSTRSGILLVVSGPSGSGKTTLCQRLASADEAEYSISCTTRAARVGELHGRDYHFLSHEEFRQRLAAGDFLEHAEVHGNFYGTLQSEVTAQLLNGRDVVMDIDVQGAAQVRASKDKIIRTAFVDLFIMPPTQEELRLRLTGRGTDSAEVIDLRMSNALLEIGFGNLYTYRMLSYAPDEDYRRLFALLTAERLRVARGADNISLI